MERPLALSSRKPSLISLGLGFWIPYSAPASHTFAFSWLLCLGVSSPPGGEALARPLPSWRMGL